MRQLQIGARPGVLYLHGGWAQLVDGLARRVEVRTGVKVSGVEPAGDRVEVGTAGGTMVARLVILAPGTPAATRALLPADPGWADLGPPVTAACLDVGVSRVPDPGYLLDVDEPVLGVVQSPPARQAPEGHALVAAVRYGATEADADRLTLARMVVSGTQPRAATGGLAGRPAVTDSGQPGVLVAGDWVGPDGLLADASLASGSDAARRGLRAMGRAPALVA